jgi:hypothetical protein
MAANARRTAFAAVFWTLLVLFVLVDRWRGAPLHNRFDEPAPWALGSGTSDAAMGAHCTAAPATK